MSKKINSSWWSVARRLKEYIRPEWPLIVGSMIALLSSVGARLLKPLPLAFVVDNILVGVAEDVDMLDGEGQSAPLETLKFDTNFFNISIDATYGQFMLLGAGAAVILIALLMAATGFTSTVGLALAGSRILTRLRSDLFSHLLSLSLRFYSQAKTGDLTMRLVNDIAMVREAVITALMPMLANTFILLGMFSVMLYLDWQLTLIAILGLPVMWWTTNRSGKKIQEVSRAQRKREGNLASRAAEFMGSIKTIQSLSLEQEAISSFEGNNSKSREQEVKSKKLSAGLERRVDFLVAIVTSIVLFKGANAVMGGSMTTGELIVFMSYLNNSFRPVREYAKYTARLSKALAASERILSLLDEKADIKDKPGAKELSSFVRGEIQFEHVRFSYQDNEKNTRTILRDMNFTIQEGESVAIVGPSGTGKTTITNLLLRLYEPNDGVIRVDGRDIQEYTISSLRKQIVVVPQESLLFGTTIRRNIALGAANNKGTLSDDDIVSAAIIANAHNFITELPDGYDTIVSERGGSLSGGQRQRIAIARAAINENSILILDEPTVGLDRESEAYVIEALQNLMQGRTTIIITHDLDFAASADRIIFIDKGVVVEEGNHKDLLAKNGSYAHWWNNESSVHF